MSILNMPSISCPAQIQFSLMPNTQSFESPLNKTIQTMELPGARWVFKIRWQAISESEARTLKAWLAQLRGMAGRFYAGDASHKSPTGTALGTPLVDGASQYGTTLNTKNWTPNQTSLLVAGDYIGVNGELKIITETCSSDASGDAVLTFEPPLRESPLDNTAIITAYPKCVFRLADDGQDQILITPERKPSPSLDCVEVFV